MRTWAKVIARPSAASNAIVSRAVAVIGVTWLMRVATSNASLFSARLRSSGSSSVPSTGGPSVSRSDTGSPKRT